MTRCVSILKTKKILAIFSFLTLLGLPVAVFALEATYPTLMGMTITSSSDLTDYAMYFINIAIGSAGILAMASMVIGGIYYLISRGIGKYTGEGLEWVKSGLLGMMLLICAYLILYTINPALVSPMLKSLIPIPISYCDTTNETCTKTGTGKICFNDSDCTGTNKYNGPPFVYYQEIPLGKLVEGVLSKETAFGCYDFDDSGDPIQNKDSNDNDSPTFIVHDRADCLAKLNFGLEKKSEILAKLSETIVGYMNNCGCQNAPGCETPQGKNCPNIKPNDKRAIGTICGGPFGCQCQTPTTCALPPTEYTMCPVGTKNMVEHGLQLFPPVFGIDVAFCSNQNINTKKYKGLDEFRIPKSSPPKDPYIKIMAIESMGNIDGKPVKIIDQKKWNDLKLIEQIMYFRQKIKEISDDVQRDLNYLQKSRDLLSSPSCYLAKPYVELLKTDEQTDKKEKIIAKILTYNQYGSPIDISKYCSGYDYANSNCQTSCENICPVSSLNNASAYKTCPTCSPANTPECLQLQKICMAEKVNERKCNSNPEGFAKFSECMYSCKNTCSDNCKEKYKTCTNILDPCPSCDGLKSCLGSCDNDSKCLLNNQDKCLYNYSSIKNCADQNPEQDGLKNCIDNSLLCEFGSEQNSGYADCLSKARALEGKDFSSSALYNKNSSYQKCSDFFSSSLGTFADGASYCKYPETAKCPTSSDCPQCPCGTIGEKDPNATPNLKGKAWFTTYAHMKNIGVTIGQEVKKGDIIGQISNVGITGPDDYKNKAHLHFTVGFESGKSGIDISTSLDISSVMGGNMVWGNVATLPSYVNENYKNYVLSSLNPPVDTNSCDWILEPVGSYLHINNAAYAQDWVCQNNSQEGANVYVMSGEYNVKSTVVNILPGSGAVIIKHEVDDSTLTSLLNNNFSDYRVTSGECGEYVYNDDPLTFYCKKDYWNDPTEKSDKPVGTERVCTKNNEIPIGQTVDNTMLWGQNFANEINNLLSATNEYIGRLQEIGQEKGYCECGSTCGAGESTCNADCTVVEIPNEDGEIVKSCMKGSCSGNPCLKMINLLLGKSSTASCPKGVEIKGLEWYQKQLLFFYNKISDFVIKSRTDIVKQLTFSREKTNQCSVVSKAYDATKETKMINCTRVIDEIISPISEGKIIINSKEINYPCYGKTLGDIITEMGISTNYNNTVAQDQIVPKTDNWFCCEQYAKKPTQ